MQPPGGGRAAGGARTSERRRGHSGSGLVVDAGRTRFRAAVYDGSGGPLTSTDGPGLPDVADGHGSAGSFAAALAPLLARLVLPRRPLDVVCVGMTGVLRPGPAAAAVAEAVHQLLPARRVLVTSDVVTGYWGAVGFGPLDEVVERVYGAGNPVGAVAAFAAQVADAARSGDRQAREIWEDAAAEVAATALAAARALGPAPPRAAGRADADGGQAAGRSGEEATLSWTGGLFHAADLLLEPFLARVAAVRPELVARPPLGSALAGGRRLAGAPDGHPLLD